jgi:hypothetical protein
MNVGLIGVDSMDETTELFRPIGLEELNLIREGGYVAFPPRLSEQPIFYPVLNEAYATQIARDWNTKHGPSKCGYVTRFRVRSSFLRRYQIHIVGGSQHQEYWIPAEDVNEFNQNIVGKIEVVSEYRG